MTKGKNDKKYAYHFTNDKLRDGQPIPAIGKWLKHSGPVVICQSGLHASRTPFQALSYAPGFKLHKVEVAGVVTEQDDKLVAKKRKIVATIDATSIILSFARKQALTVIQHFDCPPVLEYWLKTGDPDKLKEAQAASAASYAARAAANAASNAATAADWKTMRDEVYSKAIADFNKMVEDAFDAQ